ncbi:MAG: DUF1223 domain-containing protein [Flavobacterium sp.]|nr:DUF1223 domain-containing protein [Flavobacterium sp.]
MLNLSSCDELMGKIQKEYQKIPVYIMSYHVDYCDRQGWKDIFSNADIPKDSISMQIGSELKLFSSFRYLSMEKQNISRLKSLY